jgi:NTP pyrophosphatase (non-canonical NTP hydrolase)
MSTIAELQADIHQNAVEHGWWEEERNFGELMMLIATEVSEAYEHYRNNQDIVEVFYGKGDKPDGVPIELADVIIRVLDVAGHYGMDMEEAVKIKMAFNETRPYRHGGKLA